jgi:hypothetical protein
MMENLVISKTNTPTSYSLSTESIVPICDDNDADRPLDFNSSPNHLMLICDDEIIKLAKNNVGTKLVQQQVHQHGELRQRMLDLFTDPVRGKEFLSRMATDNNGNFIIQVIFFNDLV